MESLDVMKQVVYIHLDLWKLVFWFSTLWEMSELLYLKMPLQISWSQIKHSWTGACRLKQNEDTQISLEAEPSWFYGRLTYCQF